MDSTAGGDSLYPADGKTEVLPTITHEAPHLAGSVGVRANRGTPDAT